MIRSKGVFHDNVSIKKSVAAEASEEQNVENAQLLRRDHQELEHEHLVHRNVDTGQMEREPVVDMRRPATPSAVKDHDGNSSSSNSDRDRSSGSANASGDNANASGGGAAVRGNDKDGKGVSLTEAEALLHSVEGQKHNSSGSHHRLHIVNGRENDDDDATRSSSSSSVLGSTMDRVHKMESAIEAEAAHLKKIVPPLPAVLLGLLGLVPLAITHLDMLIHLPAYQDLISEYSDLISRAQIHYGAAMLCFLGAVHWGLAIANYSTAVGLANQRWNLRPLRTGASRFENWARYVFSAFPFIAGWAILSMPPIAAYASLIAAFVITLFSDFVAMKQGLVPRWWLALRLPLTLCAVLLLALSMYKFVIETHRDPSSHHNDDNNNEEEEEEHEKKKQQE